MRTAQDIIDKKREMYRRDVLHRADNEVEQMFAFANTIARFSYDNASEFEMECKNLAVQKLKAHGFVVEETRKGFVTELRVEVPYVRK